MHARSVDRIGDQRTVRRQDLDRDTVDEHVLGVNGEALRPAPALDGLRRREPGSD